jgi:DNA repair exonuclease SbcCD ATPase subunit
VQKPLAPPRKPSKSSDDLEQVGALDAAESRATAALRLMNEEREAREAAEAELERLKQADLQRQLDAVAKAAQGQPKVELANDTPKSSMRPGVLTVQAKGVKVGIPLALLTPVLAFGWAAYQNYTSLQNRVKALEAVISAKDARGDEMQRQLTEQAKDIAQLRETQASQAGYLTGVLPMAGVKVPGTGSPIQADPLPLGARRQTPVNVRTPVPTPPEK